MKPISLKLAGLHSFREPQVVDFERLCEAGLFGIFGPTGSGKSTVLDALTLALYGKVERASYGTKGILNHAEDRVLVDFIFELNQLQGRNRYRVERVYRRSRDYSVVNTGARLLEITDAGEIPLAEKGEKVSREIEVLLGLNEEDFTRAVVLPQGKFDEFLKKIKPTERRQMLERLFGLTEYGEKLKQKVNHRLEKVENKLAAFQGELDGLGDASEEALLLAGRQLEKAGRRAVAAEKQCRLAEKEFKEKEQVWTWQEELLEVEHAAAILQERLPEIEHIREKLAVAARACEAMPFLREVDEAEGIYIEAQKNFEDVRTRLEAADQGAKAVAEMLKTARACRRQEEPVLLEKKGQLARAAKLEEETSQLKEKGAGLAKVLKNLEEEKEKVEFILQEQRTKKEELENIITNCKEDLAATSVDPEWRKQVATARINWQQWQKAEKDRVQAQAEQKKKEKLLVEAQEALVDAARVGKKARERLERAVFQERKTREARPDDETAMQNSMRELEHWRAQTGVVLHLVLGVKEAEILLRSKKAVLEKSQKTARQLLISLDEARRAREEAQRRVQVQEEKLEELRRRNMAGYLARAIKEGEPCPVCGSVDHPAPTVTVQEEEVAIAGEKLLEVQASAGAAQEVLEKIQREEAAATARNAAVVSVVEEERARLAALEIELAAARSKMPAAWAGLSPKQLEEELARQEVLLTQRQKAWIAWQKNLEEKQEDLQLAREALNRAAVTLTVAGSTLKGAQEAEHEAAARLQAAVAESEKRLAELNAVRGNIPAGSIAGEQERIEYLDVQRVLLEKEREKLEKELAGVNREIENMAVREGELAVWISGDREKLAALREQYRQKENELSKITGGRPAGRLLEEVEARLKELLVAEKKAQDDEESAFKEKSTLEQVLAAVEKALSLAKERLEKGLAKLNENLNKLCFITRREAEEALLDSPEQEELQKTVEEYRQEKERLAGLFRSLTEKLAGRKLSPEQWQVCRERLEIARREQQEALLERGAAAQEYEKMIRANARWKELKKLAGDTGALKNRLEVLKELLRGNAFVDYLAEEQLVSVARDASARLGELTRQRYALEVDSEGGFLIRDEANGGIKRPVSTLSGGETFVTSLSLALALSAQIQLKGRYPLEFFFLDEGFGALDPELLEVVVSTLERTRLAHLNIGVISHLPELQNRLPRRLVVYPALAAGAGSRLTLEMA